MFAKLFADRLGVDVSTLKKAMWGDYAWKKKVRGAVVLCQPPLLSCAARLTSRCPAWGQSSKIVPMKSDKKGKLKPMFAEFVLTQLWSVRGTHAHAPGVGMPRRPLTVFLYRRRPQIYETVMINDDAKKTGKIVKKLGLEVPPRQLRGTDGTQKLRAVMRAWLPLASAVLGMVAKHLPSPTESATSRIDKVCACVRVR